MSIKNSLSARGWCSPAPNPTPSSLNPAPETLTPKILSRCMYGWSGHARTPHGNTQNRFKDFCLEAKALTVLCVPIRPTAIAAAKIFQVQEFLLLTIDMLTGACTAGRGTLERRRSALGPGRAPGGLLHLLCFIERGWQRGAHRHTRGWEIAGCLIPYTHPTPYTPAPKLACLVWGVTSRHSLGSSMEMRQYRGSSLIRNSAPLGPYSRPMPRDLW